MSSYIAGGSCAPLFLIPVRSKITLACVSHLPVRAPTVGLGRADKRDDDDDDEISGLNLQCTVGGDEEVIGCGISMDGKRVGGAGAAGSLWLWRVVG